ncbi:MAG: peroxiredoxin [Mariprofundaceae bacterium]|nr:peroxiredoxin [Mariprofundaceae bacterium]
MADYTLNVGDKAPLDLQVAVYPEAKFKLDDLSGQWVIVYFYPKDNTSGCTTESCEFRDALPDFGAANAAIVGVSRDSVKSHAGFTEKQSLNFPLISDEDETFCKAFDVIQEKMNYGKTYMGIERSTFIINPDGVVVETWRKVRVPEHVAKVLARLQALQA